MREAILLCLFAPQSHPCFSPTIPRGADAMDTPLNSRCDPFGVVAYKYEACTKRSRVIQVSSWSVVYLLGVSSRARGSINVSILITTLSRWLLSLVSLTRPISKRRIKLPRNRHSVIAWLMLQVKSGAP